MQMELFAQPTKTHLVCGGIYTDTDPDNRDPLAPYAICFGSDQFYFIFDGMMHIEEIVEVACAHKMTLIKDYGLRMNKIEKSIKIVDSTKSKSNPNYCIWQGKYEGMFWESIEKFKRIFMKT